VDLEVDPLENLYQSL